MQTNEKRVKGKDKEKKNNESGLKKCIEKRESVA